METDSQLIISVSSINRVAIVHGTLLPSCKRPGSVSERPLIRGILIFNLASRVKSTRQLVTYVTRHHPRRPALASINYTLPARNTRLETGLSLDSRRFPPGENSPLHSPVRIFTLRVNRRFFQFFQTKPGSASREKAAKQGPPLPSPVISYISSRSRAHAARFSACGKFV